MKKLRIAIFISGRGSNMKAIIEASKDPDFPAQIVLVLSNNELAAGISYAKSQNIPTKVVNHQDFQKSHDPRLAFDKKVDQEISDFKIDLICLAGFMRILSGWFVKKWQGKLINIHPSLLPEFKGAKAIEDAFNANVQKTGCTVHFVNEKIDDGPIILQAEVEINKNDTIIDLENKIHHQEHIIYPKAIKIVCEEILRNKK